MLGICYILVSDTDAFGKITLKCVASLTFIHGSY